MRAWILGLMMALVIVSAGALQAGDRVLVTATTAPGNYPTALSVITKTAGNITDFNYIQLTGDDNDLVMCWNDDSVAHTVTFSAVADPVTGRDGDITAQSLAADAIVVWGPGKLRGWAQAGGRLFVDCTSTGVKFMHLRLK